MIIPKLRSPVVLVHGLLGFAHVDLCGWTLACYFPGIPELLRKPGNRVLLASLSPTGGVAERAAELKTFLDREVPHEPVHLLGHSMGGLDARYLVSRLGMADRVLTLTTLGTPHRGTAFADWGVRRLARLVRPTLAWFRINAQAFYDLTTARCKEFNQQVPDHPRVRYFSVAGRFESHLFSPEWHLPSSIVSQAEGPNDGVVSLASATYGESTDVWEGDHLSLANWTNPVAWAGGTWRDRAPDYARLVRRLADEGY
jgi:triacylglycerol lipase